MSDSLDKITAEMRSGGFVTDVCSGSVMEWADRLESLDRQHREEVAGLHASRNSWQEVALRECSRKEAAEAALEEARACLGFFASVIKSGEPWTDTCQQRYDAITSTSKEASVAALAHPTTNPPSNR